MIPTTYAPIAAGGNLCTGYVTIEQAVIACAIVVIMSVIATAAAYKVGQWLRRG